MIGPIKLTPIGENPLVSIIIANYNYEEFLLEAVKSAIHQNYSNTEIILCDDGSTDGSTDLLQEITARENPSITILTKENGGMTSAYNMAYKHSSGEIICFLDSDDFYYSEKISKIVDAFKGKPDAGFLVHRMDKIDAEGNHFGQLPFSSELPEGWYGEHVLSTGSAPHGFPVTSALVLRREVADKFFPVNESIQYDLDEVIRRMALLTTNVVSIDHSLTAYRVHGKNFTAINVADRLDHSLPQYEIMRKEVQSYLEEISPEDVNRFPDQEDDIHYLLMKFVLTRIHNGRKKSAEYWEKMKKSKGYQNWSFWRKSFWILANYAPQQLFKKLATMYWHSRGSKLKLSRLKSLIKKPFARG